MESDVMKYLALGISAALTLSAPVFAQDAPERVTRGNLVMENIPEIPREVRERLRQYQNVRGAGFSDFAPDGGIYITTRFGETNQIHYVAQPMGARRQITFYDERTSGASVRPDGSGQFLFTRDVGGDEFFQGFLFDPERSRSVQFTTDQIRNQGFSWSRDGRMIAWAAAGWGDADYTIYMADPADPTTAQEVLQGEGAMSPVDWSPDGSRLLIGRYFSINEARLYVLDIEQGTLTQINPDETNAYGAARFSASGDSIFVVTDEGAEFRRIMEIPVDGGEKRVVAEHDWDVQAMALSPD
ncbi:MAG TPA: S9 family peptidase, partial [Oceanicaulis sp.]|nr:S9 family peptidase [Oceanicaulis sp.]